MKRWAAIAFLICARSVVAANALPTTQPISGTVLDIDGKPATDVKVVAIAAGRAADVTDDEIIDDDDGRPTKSDLDGHWSFGPATRPVGTVLAVTKGGRAIALASDFVEDGHLLRVLPLVYIEGTVRLRGQIAAKADVKATSLAADFGKLAGESGGFTKHVQADDNGHFRVAALAGEEVQLGRVQDIHWGDNVPRSETIVAPREGIAHHDIGGGGRLVTFHVGAGSGLKFNQAQIYFTPDIDKIVAAEPEWPAESVRWAKGKQDAFLATWKNSDAGKAAIQAADEKYRARNYYYGTCDASGAVRLEDVLPGNYYRLVIARGIDEQGANRRMEVSEKLTIIAPPKASPDEPQLLKEITLGIDHTLYAGDTPPTFDFAALDPDAPAGTRVKLGDFVGKVTLFHFWATWCGPCRAATPVLKAIEERFGNDPHFASVHIALDETMPPAQRYVFAEQLGGTEAWAGAEADQKMIEAWGASGIPTMVLVGADGKVIKSVNDPNQIAMAIEAAVRETQTH